MNAKEIMNVKEFVYLNNLIQISLDLQKLSNFLVLHKMYFQNYFENTLQKYMHNLRRPETT